MVQRQCSKVLGSFQIAEASKRPEKVGMAVALASTCDQPYPIGDWDALLLTSGEDAITRDYHNQ